MPASNAAENLNQEAASQGGPQLRSINGRGEGDGKARGNLREAGTNSSAKNSSGSGIMEKGRNAVNKVQSLKDWFHSKLGFDYQPLEPAEISADPNKNLAAETAKSMTWGSLGAVARQKYVTAEAALSTVGAAAKGGGRIMKDLIRPWRFAFPWRWFTHYIPDALHIVSTLGKKGKDAIVNIPKEIGNVYKGVVEAPIHNIMHYPEKVKYMGVVPKIISGAATKVREVLGWTWNAPWKIIEAVRSRIPLIKHLTLDNFHEFTSKYSKPLMGAGS